LSSNEIEGHEDMVFGSGGIDNKCGELIRKTKGRKKCDEAPKFVYLDDSDFDYGL
jgi:hypothetical protein